MSEIPVGFMDRRKEGETTLRQCQLVQLHLLHVVDAVCRKHDIRYFLHGGTLLGAIRHNGFIPWDDDLDIGMPMADYRRFLKIAPSEFPADVELDLPQNHPHVSIPFAKVRDLGSYYHEAGQNMLKADPSGIYIDVFGFEDMPKLPVTFQRMLAQMVASPWMRQRWFLARASDHVWLSPLIAILAIGCAILHGIARIIFAIIRSLLPCEDYFLELEKGDPCPFKKQWIFPIGSHRFEDADFPVPGDANACLTASYGNWREIPPLESRPRHARIIDPFNAAV